jgi:hypothetical protein
MSSVLQKNQNTLRVSPTFDAESGWDGPVKKIPRNLDCVWKQKKDGRATLHILPSNNPVFCCHYQHSKREIAEIFSNTDQKEILGADLVMWSANSGLNVFNDQV